MGQKVVLSDTTFTDTSLPVVLNDPLISSGSLFLFDPAHSMGEFTGVPANGGTVPNIVWSEASAVLGSGTATTLAGSVVSVSPTEASKSLVERTTKKGVHQIISLTAQTSSNSWLVTLPTLIRSYMYTHRTDHSFYVSMWHKVTRAGTTNAAVQSPLHYAVTSANYLFHAQNGIPNCAGSNKKSYPSGINDVDCTAGQHRFLSLNPSAQTGTGVGSTTDINFGLGNFDVWQTFNMNKCSSRVIYRVYVEDLTVSGRTYAEVEALDYALFEAAFASGGKFYGDTYTAPSTIP